MEENNLLTFKAISNFIKALDNVFGEKQRSLKLYNHLIEKTTIVHEEPIKKHIKAWYLFFKQNKASILNKNYKDFSAKKVIYSDKVYINLYDIFEIADKSETEIMWKHLLIIVAYLDPSSKAKEILKKNATKNTNEDNFLHNIINQVEDYVDPSSNPMEAVNKIMGSGVFQNLVQNMNTGLTDGSLDLGKLMGSVNNMVNSLSSAANSSSNLPPEMSQMTNMLNSMVNNMSDKPNKVEIVDEPKSKSSKNESGSSKEGSESKNGGGGIQIKESSKKIIGK